MNKFKEIAATRASISKRRLVYGVGINDANYMVCVNIDGKKTKCPYYSRWSGMLERCYSKKYLAKKPTYIGCSVSNEWLTFSNFKKWMELQDWKEKELDKDILIQGNKVYSSSTCVFVDMEINALLNTNKASRGKHKQGVIWCEDIGKFRSRVNNHGKKKHLGYFSSEDEASEAYITERLLYVKSVAMGQNEPIRSALLRHKFS